MKDIFSLEGKVVVITGGAGYLGSVMTGSLLEYGGTVVVADIIEKKPEEIVGNTEFIGNLHVVQCNLSQTISVKDMFRKVKECFGRIDVLVNCAAYGGGSGGKGISGGLDNISDDIWEASMDGTVGVTFRCIREALPYFQENGKGNIINIASMYGLVSPDPGIYGTSGQNSPPTYGVGKAGVLQLTRYCAAYLAGRNIRVNSITPGPFPDIRRNVDEAFLTRLKAKTMLNRIGKPEELVGALVLLASEASSYMTGSNIVVDGGWTAW
jgi:Dehydrogenases with different specificities (related to short-chain alcohol dehydrogenases)